MVNYGKVLSYPSQDWKKVLLGGILNIVPVVNFLSAGYLLNVYLKGIKGQNDLPEWKSFWQIFVKGLFVTIIAFIYALPAVLLLILAITGSVMSGIMAGGAFIKPSTPLVAGIISFDIIWFIAVIFFLPMAFARYAEKRKPGAAFDFKEIMKRIRKGSWEYFGAFLLFNVMTVAVTLVFTFLPILGVFISNILAFYIGISAAWTYGRIYARK